MKEILFQLAAAIRHCPKLSFSARLRNDRKHRWMPCNKFGRRPDLQGPLYEIGPRQFRSGGVLAFLFARSGKGAG